MAFKLKSGNKPSFKQMAIGLEPLQESPYMQRDDILLSPDGNIANIKGYTYDADQMAYIKDESLVNPEKVNIEKSISKINKDIDETYVDPKKFTDKPDESFVKSRKDILRKDVKDEVGKDTNITKEQYVDGKLRKKTITYTNPKSMPGVQQISQKQKPGRNIVKTKIKYTDSKTGDQFITKQKRKKGGDVKEKTRKKGSILSIQDKEKMNKFFQGFKRKNN